MNKGFVSILILFMLLLIALLSITMKMYVESSLKVYAKEAVSFHLRNEANNHSWWGNRNGPSRLSYNHITSDKGNLSIVRNVYALKSTYKNSLIGNGKIIGGKKVSSSYPIFDYSILFMDSDKCNYEDDSLPDWLSDDAYHSSRTCNLDIFGGFVRNKIVRSNIKGDRVVFTGAESNVLASTGYIELEDVVVALPALIVAGGDIRIKNLSTELDVVASLTIISASGMVIIDKIDGLIRLYVIAWQGMILPYNAFLIKNSKTPNVLPWIPWMVKNENIIE